MIDLTHAIKIGFIPFGLACGNAASSQSVEWMNGTVQGQGCSKADTAIFTFADEISYVFSSLGINLSGAGGIKAQNKFCNLAAEAHVHPQHYVAVFQQVLSYGGIKTRWGSQASITSSAQFYGHHLKPFKVMLRNGMDFNQPLVTETLSDDRTALQPASWWCKPHRNPKDQLKARIAVSGQLVGNEAGSVALSAQSFDVKYAARILSAPCPEG